MAAVNASAQLRAVALRLREAGAGALFNDVRAEIRAEAEPLVVAVQEAAQRKLPHTGGLNERVASQHVRVSVLTGARSAGVRLAYPTRKSAGALTNQGYVNHPVFADSSKSRREWAWVNHQELPNAAGWWTDTLRQDSPGVTPRIVATIDRVSAWIQGAGI